jgi:hypothetical protein
MALSFTSCDLDKTLGQLFGHVTLETLDLSKGEYYACKSIYNNYVGIWDQCLEAYHVEWYGFANLKEMQVAFAKSKLYTDIRRYPDVGLDIYISWTYHRTETEDNKKTPYQSENLLDMLLKLDLNELLCLGI